MSLLKSKRIKVVLIALTLSFSYAGYAGTGLTFLEIGGGARATGMGEAFTAVKQDPSAIFWNPAGILSLANRQAHFTHNEWLQDVSNEFLSVVFPSSKGTLGFSLILNNVGGIERRTKATAEPLAEFSAHDLAFGLTFAKTLGENIALGLTGKYLYEKIYIESASGFAFDFGMNYKSPVSGLYFGVALQNLGQTNKMKQERIVLPTTMRIGLAYQLPGDFLEGVGLFAVDAVKVSEEDLHVHFGGEYRVFGRAAFRAGYQTGYDEKGLSAGFGLMAGRFVFDYAFMPYGSNLGSAHRVSLGVEF